MEERLDLLVRTKMFALRIIRLYSSLPKSAEAQIIGKQLLRSGTSVWLELLTDSGIMKASRLDDLRKEAGELTAILVTGAKTLKSKKGNG